MNAVSALDVRNNLGRILDDLDSTGEPIVINKGRTARAVLISLDDFERRFIEYQAQERRRELIERVRRMRAPAPAGADTVEVLRRLRGYDPA